MATYTTYSQIGKAEDVQDINWWCPFGEIRQNKLCELREHLEQAILSEATKVERATTILYGVGPSGTKRTAPEMGDDIVWTNRSNY